MKSVAITFLLGGLGIAVLACSGRGGEVDQSLEPAAAWDGVIDAAI